MTGSASAKRSLDHPDTFSTQQHDLGAIPLEAGHLRQLLLEVRLLPAQLRRRACRQCGGIEGDYQLLGVLPVLSGEDAAACLHRQRAAAEPQGDRPKRHGFGVAELLHHP